MSLLPASETPEHTEKFRSSCHHGMKTVGYHQNPGNDYQYHKDSSAEIKFENKIVVGLKHQTKELGVLRNLGFRNRKLRAYVVQCFLYWTEGFKSHIVDKIFS